MSSKVARRRSPRDTALGRFFSRKLTIAVAGTAQELGRTTAGPPEVGDGDCRIWEQCLELLSGYDVVFVAADQDFQSHRDGKSLHPQLRAEAEESGAGRSLTFHPDMESLLRELKSEIPTIPDVAIFEFVYEASRETIQELQSNSECRTTATGTIKQTRLATEARDVIEVRLEVEDRWGSPDGATSLRFELSGSCRYHLGNERLADLRTDVVHLLVTEPDGSVRAVKGNRDTGPSGHAGQRRCFRHHQCW